MDKLVIVVDSVDVVDVVVVVVCVVAVVNAIPVVVTLITCAVLTAYKFNFTFIFKEKERKNCTRVVTVPVVGGVVVVDVVLDRLGFQISNCQNVGSVIGADSASIQFLFQIISFFLFWFYEIILRQKSFPLDAPKQNKVNKK